MTDEVKKESEERIKNFMEGYQELVKKYDVDFLSYPQFVPAPNGIFQVQMVMNVIDKKQLPVKSPIQKDSIIKES